MKKLAIMFPHCISHSLGNVLVIFVDLCRSHYDVFEWLLSTSTFSLNVYFLFQLGVDTVPVLVGPVTYLVLSKPAKGVDKSFCLLSLLPKVLAVYK